MQSAHTASRSQSPKGQTQHRRINGLSGKTGDNGTGQGNSNRDPGEDGKIFLNIKAKKEYLSLTITHMLFM